MSFGSESDTPYQIFIKENDREKAINIIKHGLSEYVSVEDFTHDKFFKHSELCNTPKAITFATLIHNLDELIDMNADGRSKNTIKVVWGIQDEDFDFPNNAEDLLNEYA